MGGQTRTDNLPYKLLIPVFGFFMPVTCSGVPADILRNSSQNQLDLVF